MQSKTPSLFDEIYNAALQGDISTLESIYQRNQTLDVCFKRHTPSSRLAAEGNRSALKHLQNFPLNINWVALGLAMGGDVAAALECVAKRGAHINWVALGLAKGGHVAAALECVAKRRAHINWVAQGLARGGHVDAALECVVKHGADIDLVARGLAEGGDVAAALECVAKRGANINEVAQGLAEGGQVDAALECVAKCDADIDSVAMGLACSGHVAAALECVAKRGANIDWVAMGLARGGYCNSQSMLLRTLQVCPTSGVRKQLVTALKQAKAMDSFLVIQLEPQTLTLSNKIAERVASYELSFNQAHVWLTNQDLRMMLLYFRPDQRVFVHPECFYLVCQQLCGGNITVHEIKNLYAQVRFNLSLKLKFNLSLKLRFNLEDKAPLVHALELYLGNGVKRVFNTISRFFNHSIDYDAQSFLANCRAVQSKEGLIELLQQTLEQIKSRGQDAASNSPNDPFIHLLKTHLSRLTPSNQAKLAELDSDSEDYIDGYTY